MIVVGPSAIGNSRLVQQFTHGEVRAGSRRVSRLYAAIPILNLAISHWMNQLTLEQLATGGGWQ